MEKKIIHFSRFVPTINLGGGARRTLQIMKVFEPFNPEMISSSRGGGIKITEEELFFNRAIKLRHYYENSGKLKYWSTFDTGKLAPEKDGDENINGHNLEPAEFKKWSPKYRGVVSRLRRVSGEWANLLGLPGLSLALVDDPIYFVPLLEKLKECNVPVIAACQNLESLVASQVEPDSTLYLFKKETDLLSRCHLVITISREETFLLHNLGIKTGFFPYYPVKPILNRLLKVRKKRKKTGKDGILLLGNAMNIPNRRSMEKVIAFWQSSELFKKEGKLLVAGYGAEQFLKIDYNSDVLEFLGTISNNELYSLLCTVRACLCYQEKGTGALTRICEMLIAGVPVLANSNAARSYYNMNGVIEFRNLHDLDKALKQIDRLEGQIPIPLEPNPSYLVSEIKKIMV